MNRRRSGTGRSAGGGGTGELEGNKELGNLVRLPDLPAEGVNDRCVRRQGGAGMVLDPLAKICVGVLVAVRIGQGQFVVHFQRNGKGRQREEHAAQHQR